MAYVNSGTAGLLGGGAGGLGALGGLGSFGPILQGISGIAGILGAGGQTGEQKAMMAEALKALKLQNTVGQRLLTQAETYDPMKELKLGLDQASQQSSEAVRTGVDRANAESATGGGINTNLDSVLASTVRGATDPLKALAVQYAAQAPHMKAQMYQGVMSAQPGQAASVYANLAGQIGRGDPSGGIGLLAGAIDQLMQTRR